MLTHCPAAQRPGPCPGLSATEELREKLKQEYALRQAAIKAEPLEITYSYYNGTGHRRTVGSGAVAATAAPACCTGGAHEPRRAAAQSQQAAAGGATTVWPTPRLPATPLPPQVTVRKGDTIGQFLKAVIEQLRGSFRELRCGRGLGGGRSCAAGGRSIVVSSSWLCSHTLCCLQAHPSPASHLPTCGPA